MENISNFIDQQSTWDRTKIIVSKTDCSGKIVYINDVFQKVSGYDRSEIIGKSQHVTKHPDMPKVIFRKLWKSFENNDKNYAIVKEQSRDGKYSWALAEHTADKDKKKQIIGYTSVKYPVSESVVEFIEPLYKTLLDIEKVKGTRCSEQYLNCLLKEEYNQTYENLILDIVKKHIGKTQKDHKKPFLKSFFF